MNNKRQTIWLVSMLSLMVILSAYYLFTEDAPRTDNASKTQQTDILNAGKVSTTNPNDVEVTEVDQSTDSLAGTQKDGAVTDIASGDASGTDKETSSGSKDDEAVLKGLTNQKGNQLLEQKLLDQRESISKKSEDLNAIIANTKVSQEEAITAAEELSRLQDTDERITSLQEKLLQDFDNAVVSEEDTNFKVIVLSDKLEKKQAVGIIELATKELNVTPDKVTVQYVQ
ncbi:SpoIIIAH-like family protein [Cohnella silvisoli]|uniref:SpoIIIAH-like family protein n=1 Tax=Cohnella silvisoli TaxID=2873699 RepID=A0ABV1KSL4_9BACL|nr:SpoIIIAH-like family protein [Cohnella silvisoli]MCD9021327.1 SpoIIIAH-like family protein [Cohnella silvisoli]